MSYVDSQLLSGETVVYRAHLHKILFLPAAIVSTLGLVAGIFAAGTAALWPVIGLASVAAAISAVSAWIHYGTSEYAVTNKRVIIKEGWIRRRSLETLLSKIEGIGVDQDIIGRILGFGTISITGTGGTRESFRRIASPLEFRRQVQEVLSGLEESRAGVVAPGSAYPAAPREERECPFCAERILAKAKVCKHCGREVAAVNA